MSEEEGKKASGAWARLISELLGIVPTEMRELIGLHAGVYLFILVPMIVIGGGMALVRILDKDEAPSAQCWHLQKIDSRIFKVNACTGKTEELKPDSPKPAETAHQH